MGVELEIKPAEQRNLIEFFTNFNIPHIVTIHVNGLEFLCSSVILALHSDTFCKVIYSGIKDIFLDEFSYQGADHLFRDCLVFLYGNNITVNMDNIIELCKFAIIYGINSLWIQCIKYISSELRQYPENIFHLYCLMNIVLVDTDRKLLQVTFDEVLIENYPFIVDHLYHQVNKSEILIDDIDGGLFKSIIRLATEV